MELIDNNLPERMRRRNISLYQAMKNGEWFTLKQIEQITHYPSATASAGIRDFRKREYGSNTVEKNYLGEGIYQYRLIINPENNILKEKLDI